MSWQPPETDPIASTARPAQGGGWQPPETDPFASDEDEDVPLWRLAAGLGVEIGGGAGSQALGAALGVKSLGIGYLATTFLGGYGSSVLAQEIESPDGDISQARAITTGLINMIPGSFLMKKPAQMVMTAAGREVVEAALKKEAASAVVRRGAAGALTATAYEAGSSVGGVLMGEEGAELPSASGLMIAGVGGTVLGAGFEKASQSLARKLKGMTPKQAQAAVAKMIRDGDPDIEVLHRQANAAVNDARLARQAELEQVWPPILANKEAEIARVQRTTDAAQRAKRQMDLEAAFKSNQPELPIEQILVESRANMYARADNALQAGIVKTYPKALVTKAVADEVAQGMGALREQRLPIRKPSFMADDVPMGTPLADDLPLQSTVDDALRSLPGLRKPPTRSDEFRFGIAPATPRIGEALAALSGGTVGAAKAYADNESMTIGFAGGAIAGVGLYRGAKSKAFNDVFGKALRYVAPSRVVGSRTALVVNERKAADTVYNEAVGQVRDKMQKWAVRQDDPDAAVALISDVLTGKKWVSDVPPEIRGEMQYLTELRTELQQQLLRDVPTLTDDMRGLITASRDQYLTTEYRVHFDKSYTPSPAVRANLIAKLKSEGLSDTEVNRFLQEVADEQTFMGMITGRSSDRNGILIHKKDLSKEVREYLGEVHDPLEKIYGTINKMNRIVSAAREEQDILLNGELGGWIRKGVVGDEGWVSYPSRYTKDEYSITKEADMALRLLAGKGFRFMDSVPMMGEAINIWRSANALSKFAAVPANAAAYAVQVWSNFFLAVQTPGITWHGAKKGMRVAWNNTGVPYVMKGDKAVPNYAAIQKDLDMLRRYNILDQNVAMQDIRNGFQGLGKSLTQAFEPATTVIGKGYQLPDNAFRLTTFYANRQNLVKMGSTLTGEALDREAARITNMTFPNYSRLNTTVKELSRLGVFQQFVAFTAELFRTTWNNLSYGAELVSRGKATGNWEMMKQGGYRLGMTGGLLATTAGGISYINASNGITEGNKGAYKRAYVPSYDEDRELVLRPLKDNTVLEYANPSYVAPHSIISNIVTQFLEADGKVEGVLAAAQAIAGEFGGEGTLVWQALASAVSNSRPEGAGRVTEIRGVAGTPERVAYFIENGFPIGTLREYRNLRDALSGTERTGGRILEPADTLKRLGGYRAYSYDMLKAGAQKAKPIVSQQMTARGNYRQAIDNKKTPTDIEKEYRKSSALYERAFRDSVQRVQDFRTTGRTDPEIVTMLKDAGMGSQEILSAMQGVFVPLPRELPTLASELYETRLVGRSAKDQIAELRELAKTDPVMARNVRNLMVGDKRREYRGISETDRLIGNLSVGTGQRGRYLAAQLKDLSTEDRNRRLDELARKGLVNQKVRQDVMKELYGQ